MYIYVLLGLMGLIKKKNAIMLFFIFYLVILYFATVMGIRVVIIILFIVRIGIGCIVLFG